MKLIHAHHGCIGTRADLLAARSLSPEPLKITGMGTCSKDLRLKVLSAADRSVPRKETVELFGVSLATIKQWLKRCRENGDVETPLREAF